VRVLVTGGSGLIGSHLVEFLIEQGHEVVCLLRRPQEETWLKGLPIIPAVGDLTRPESLAEALSGVERVYHLAGQTRGRGFRGNVQAAAGLVEAVKRYRPELGRLVLTSSLAAQGPSPLHRPLTEADPPRPVSDYGRSKLVAEGLLLDLAPAVPVSVLRLAAVYGPRDENFLFLFRQIKRGLALKAIRSGQKVSLIHVADAVQGIGQAAEALPEESGLYLLADGQAYTQTEVTGLAARFLEVSPRSLAWPRPVAALSALVAEAIGLFRGRPGIFGWDKYRELIQTGWWADPTRARQRLGFSPRFDLASGLAQTMDWYKNQGWL